ncbi:glycine betaine ABC transporter substrate-binding protein [Pantanalinema rosaneae CENA516]|uniref:glycine betaine ABC transporter substrate-binding protein n=1 Tax=Pantanalinema rosaneae TaxID=1620701 RepID=UPI003D6DAB50
MKRFFSLFLIAIVLTLGLGNCQPQSSSVGQTNLVIASKGFTEQDILQELLAQQIEHHTNLTVDRRRLVGFVSHKALLSGDIDAYVEYTGTAYTGIFKQPTISDPQEIYRRLQSLYAKHAITVLPSLGFENTFAMMIRGEDAQTHQIQTLSQAAQYTPQWRAGFGYEFLEREDGFPGLAKTYNLQFAQPPQVMDLGLIYRALMQHQVDFIAGNSTDGQIARLGLVVLKDDRRYFPPYEAVPLIRQATLQKYPQIQTAIAPLRGLISADEMRQMNYLVEGELQDIKVVVSNFLQSKRLL